MVQTRTRDYSSPVTLPLPCTTIIPPCVNIINNDDMCVPHKTNAIEILLRKKRIALNKANKVKICTVTRCTKHGASHKGGVCHFHSGKLICSVNGCTKFRQNRTVCVGHGAILIIPKCKYIGCTKFRQHGGFCYKHGGGYRCIVFNCKRGSTSTKCSICPKHIKTITLKNISAII